MSHRPDRTALKISLGMTRHTVSVVHIHSQNIGISKIRKEIGDPGEILGQKILNKKEKQKMLTPMVSSAARGEQRE